MRGSPTEAGSRLAWLALEKQGDRSWHVLTCGQPGSWDSHLDSGVRCGREDREPSHLSQDLVTNTLVSLAQALGRLVLVRR